MKRIALIGLSFVAFSAVQASAADLPVKAAPAPSLICPTCNWSGFYIGVNAGGSIGIVQNTDAISGFPTGAGFPATGNPYLSSDTKRALPGWIAGGQVGFNFQPTGSPWVFGIEGDWDYSAERSTMNVLGQNIAASLFSSGYQDEQRIKSIATFRGRLGWSNMGYLWYVTGGGAWASIDSNYVLSSNLPAVTFASPFAVGFNTNKFGWTIGGGVETCLWDGHWTAKLEYLYVNFGTIGYAFSTPTTTAGTFATFTSSNRVDDHLVRAGINYKF
jgi:outer membrane immunogenic protein